MKILAIETSCDETAICLITATTKTNTADGTSVVFSVIKNITHTQLEHKEFGGVFPVVAKREHQKNLPLILEEIMRDQEIPDVICVTNGPGLEPALWCGIVFAKELGNKWNIPVIPVNHMEGHILSVFVPDQIIINKDSLGAFPTFTVSTNTISFPALALLISGGHTELVLINDIGEYKIIGRTKDDAVGEAFDKVARMMNLPYPGGPEIARLAKEYNERLDQPHAQDTKSQAPKTPLVLPRPMIHSKDYDFSFSGLKTAVRYHIQSLSETPSLLEQQEIAWEFQNAATDVLIKKTLSAIEYFGIQTLILGGGVSANQHITSSFRETLSQKFPEMSCLIPTRELTGDNALMIALAGYFKLLKNPDTVYPDIKAVGNLEL